MIREMKVSAAPLDDRPARRRVKLLGARGTLGVLAATLLAGTAAGAAEVMVVDNILAPEGPLVVAGNLYYVSGGSNTVSRWDGKTSTIINTTPGCVNTGLALTKRKTFLVACNDAHGAILEIDLQGKQLRRWDADTKGRKFDGGVNDFVVAANGGAYATLSGPGDEPPVPVMGKIFYLAPGGQQWVLVAEDFNYANGLGVSPDQKTLYVSETVGNSIKKFTINADGTLSNRSNFALLNLLVKDKVQDWFLGPDSMKVDRKGNIYVGQWGGAKVLKISPEGKLLHVFDIAAGEGTTDVAFDEGEKNLYITVTKDIADPKQVGRIVKVANVD